MEEANVVEQEPIEQTQDDFSFKAELDKSSEVLILYEDIEECARELVRFLRISLAEVGNVELFAPMLHANALKHARELVRAAEDIQKKGVAVFSYFGEFRSTTSILEIEDELEDTLSELSVYKKALAPTFKEFVDKVLPVVDKYLFDGRNIEAAQTMPYSLCVLTDKSTSIDLLNKKHVFDKPAEDFLELSFDPENPSVQKEVFTGNEIVYLNADLVYYGVFDSEKKLPDIVVLQVPRSDDGTMVNRFIEYFNEEIPRDKRPHVIAYFEGRPTTLLRKQQGAENGWLVAGNPDELRNVIAMTKNIMLSRKLKPEFFDPVILSESQKILYNNSELRDWEELTADTYQSMKHLLRLVKQWRSEEVSGFYKARKPRILDCGTGEGRLGGMFARLGWKVIGVDIAKEQLQKIPERVAEETAGLRAAQEGIPRENSRPLSYPALLKLIEEDNVKISSKDGIIQDQILMDNEAILDNYRAVEADFATLLVDLSRYIKKMPNNDKNKFFDINLFDYSYPSGDPLEDISFDFITFNWHTLCEAGSIDSIKDVLQQVWQVLDRGGYLVIEIPDRLVGPYAHSLLKYSKDNEDKPFGTIQDTTSTDPGVSTVVDGQPKKNTPRYFPDRNELIILLKSIGFEVETPETYLITNEDPDTGKPVLQAKELFIKARRPDR